MPPPSLYSDTTQHTQYLSCLFYCHNTIFLQFSVPVRGPFGFCIFFCLLVWSIQLISKRLFMLLLSVVRLMQLSLLCPSILYFLSLSAVAYAVCLLYCCYKFIRITSYHMRFIVPPPLTPCPLLLCRNTHTFFALLFFHLLVLRAFSFRLGDRAFLIIPLNFRSFTSVIS